MEILLIRIELKIIFKKSSIFDLSLGFEYAPKIT